MTTSSYTEILRERQEEVDRITRGYLEDMENYTALKEEQNRYAIHVKGEWNLYGKKQTAIR